MLQEDAVVGVVVAVVGVMVQAMEAVVVVEVVEVVQAVVVIWVDGVVEEEIGIMEVEVAAVGYRGLGGSLQEIHVSLGNLHAISLLKEVLQGQDMELDMDRCRLVMVVLLAKAAFLQSVAQSQDHLHC
jgi:hypothetical protein